MVRRQVLKHVRGVPSQRLSLEYQPFIEGLAVLQEEPGEKVAPVKFSGPAEPGVAGRTLFHLAVAVGAASFDQSAKLVYVQRITTRVDLHGLGSDKQERG